MREMNNWGSCCVLLIVIMLEIQRVDEVFFVLNFMFVNYQSVEDPRLSVV